MNEAAHALAGLAAAVPVCLLSGGRGKSVRPCQRVEHARTLRRWLLPRRMPKCLMGVGMDLVWAWERESALSSCAFCAVFGGGALQCRVTSLVVCVDTAVRTCAVWPEC